jgi:hypothetical protein
MMRSKHFLPTYTGRQMVFYWPIERRELNLFGKPGKLHAKVVVVDRKALITSAKPH